MPDLNTSSEHVQNILAIYIDHLLEIGVSGFRVLAAGHMNSKDIREIFSRSRNEINEDIYNMTSSRSRLPVLIIDLWPPWLIRFPHLQPDFYPDEMTPYRYNEISNNAYNTDMAFSFVVADTFYRKHSSMSLRNLTELSVTTRFSHPMYKQKADLIPLGKLILQVTNHFLTFYGVENCPPNVNGTVDVKNVFHNDVCPSILSTAWDEKLLVLGTIWMMTLPVGYTRVYSSYDWNRSYKINEHGHPFDKLFSSGPPRSVDGGTLDVICGSPSEVDISPAFVDDGTRWMCEHRNQDIAAMPKWRLEVAKSSSYQLKLNEWFGDDDVSNYFVSISRSMRQGPNGQLRGGWVAINADPTQSVKKKFATRLPAGVYKNGAKDNKNQLLVVDSRGILETKLEPFETIIIHTADMIPDTYNTSLIVISISLFFWIMIPVVACYITIRKHSRDRDIVTRESSSAALAENGKVTSVAEASTGSFEEEVISSENETSAMVCALEHIVPETFISEKVNQKVGGLGKVIESTARFHPGPLVMVTPMMGSVSYPAMREAEPILCTVDNKEEVVRIFHYRWTGTDKSVESIFCQHDNIFGARTAKDEDLYPNDEKDLDHFLSFFALWSQTVAKLVLRHRKQLDVLHLCDYHTAFAPTFIKAHGGSIPVMCTLHNASYQGNIKNNCLAYISKIVGISEKELATNFTLDDDFNMLSGLISYFKEEQNGHGFCAVSKNYAKEIPMLIDSFRVGQVQIRSLPNPELKCNRPTSLHHITTVQELREIKRQKKVELQHALGLRIDPDAMIAAFVGRLVIQKGVDAIADAATELLLRYKKLQLIVVGPIGDVFGRYASTRLTLLSRNKMFGDRIFCMPKFFRFTPDFRLGCDIALMPSRTEPFGFVDIEFAWCGCPVVGSLVGGLGKVPGWYFKLWEGGNYKHLKTQLCCTVDKVMEQGHDKVLELGFEAIQTSFPVLNWQKKLSLIYHDIINIAHSTSLGCVTNLLGRKVAINQLMHDDLNSSSSTHGYEDDSLQLWSLSTTDEDVFLVHKDTKPQKKLSCLLKDETIERQDDNVAFLDEEEGYKNSDDISQSQSSNSDKSSNEPCKDTTAETIILLHSSEEGNSHQNRSYDEYLSEVLEEKTTETLFTGRKTNVLTVFKSTVWNQEWTGLPEKEFDLPTESINDPRTNICPTKLCVHSSRAGVMVACERMLEQEFSGRSVQSWIIAVLSIMMPSHSTLLYAKSIVWAKAYSWDNDQINGLYAAHFAAYAIACLIWLRVLRHISIGYCVAVSSLLHMVSILFFTDASDNGYFAAVLIAAATGIVSSASGPIFTATMFFDEWDGSLSSKMKNFGWIEGSRTIFSGILQGAIIVDFMALPSDEGMSAPLIKSSLLFNIYIIVGFITILGSSLLLLGMKEKIRLAVLPRVKLSSVLCFKTFTLLSFSSILEGVISYPTLFIVSWLLLDGFSAESTGSWVIVSSSAIGFAIFVFTLLFNRIHEAPKCISVLATHLPQPVMLQALIMMAAPNMSAGLVLVLLGITSFLIKLKGGLIAVLKLHVLHSRWKVVTYSCYELFLTNLASAASPFIMRSMANSMNLSLNTVGPGTSPEASATASFYAVLPFVIIIMILQLTANKYAFLDISEVYTKIDFYENKIVE